MSLKRRAAAFGVASFFACAPAAGEDTRPRTSVALLAGYGVELETILDARESTGFGAAFGARWGVTLAQRWYVGATFISHLGTLELAHDAARTSTYRGSYHRSYFGPEIGLDLHLGPALVRPWLGTGVLVAINRTSVRAYQHNDDALLFYVAPGILGGVELGRWLIGLDVRIPIAPAEPWRRWAPAPFVVTEHHW